MKRLALLVILGSLAAASSALADADITLCHATGSESNPFVQITVSPEGAYNGHIDHQDVEDIIPPFEFQGQMYSQNWPSGQAILENGCEIPVVEEPPTEEPPPPPPVVTTPPTPPAIEMPAEPAPPVEAAAPPAAIAPSSPARAKPKTAKRKRHHRKMRKHRRPRMHRRAVAPRFAG